MIATDQSTIIFGVVQMFNSMCSSFDEPFVQASRKLFIACDAPLNVGNVTCYKTVVVLQSVSRALVEGPSTANFMNAFSCCDGHSRPNGAPSKHL